MREYMQLFNDIGLVVELVGYQWALSDATLCDAFTLLLRVQEYLS